MATFQYSFGRGRGTPPTAPGPILGTLFFLAFAGIGLAVATVFATSMVKGLASWRWESGQCRVLSSRVDDLLFSLPPEAGAKESEPYRLDVEYQWERDGRSFHGRQVGGSAQYRSRLAAAEAAGRYPAGSDVSCYVDPRDPTQAVLRRPRLWGALIIGFPLVFVGFGVAGLIAVWSRGVRRPKGAVLAPRSEARSRRAGPGCAAAAFSLFAIFGG